jgi:dihydroorotase
MHVHFRDPGFTYKEDIITGAAAAAAGGVTTAVCMPNTKPVIDTPELVRYMLDRARSAAIEVLPYAAVTVGQKGSDLTDHDALRTAGAAALSDDGVPIDSADAMRRGLLSARAAGLLLCAHCEYGDMVKNYAVNEGRISERLGLPGRPAIAEELMAARDAMLAKETGARVHICHVSTEGTVEIVRRAKADGVHVTCETCPQYFTATEELVEEKGALARVNPPLRTERDRQAVIRGLRDGTIDAIVTDHAPHSAEEKAAGLEKAPSGMVGLETSLALALTVLCGREGFSLSDVVRLMSVNPARILGLKRGTLAVGMPANAVLFRLGDYRIDASRFCSKAKNTPFDGMAVKGKVQYTLCRGEIVYRG